MSNPLYQMIMGGGMQQPMQPMNGFSQGAMGRMAMDTQQHATGFSRMAMAMQAMQNPVAFVKKAFPDIPPEIENDPNQFLRYLQQTRGITNQDIQNLMNR